MNRRNFLLGAVVLPLAASLPLSLLSAPQDEYDDFLERVRHKVAALVRREGRGLHRLYIDPPRADGARYVRTVHIFLEPGPSLLDKLHFQFDEVSGSRLTWGGI
jgi:hypothetical protein